MIKKITMLVLVGLMLMAGSAFAVELQAGADIEAVLDRNVEIEALGGEIDADLNAQYYDVKLDLKVGDWLTVTPKAGINSFGLENDDVFGYNGELQGGIGWNVGADVKADILKTKYADLSAIGSYRFARTDVDNIKINGIEIDNPLESILYTHEWELGAIVSKDLKEFGLPVPVKPYVGLVYSDLRGDIDTNLSLVDLDAKVRAKDNFGIRTGVTAEPVKDLYVSVDCKFVDQTAIGGSVTYKF